MADRIRQEKLQKQPNHQALRPALAATGCHLATGLFQARARLMAEYLRVWLTVPAPTRSGQMRDSGE